MADPVSTHGSDALAEGLENYLSQDIDLTLPVIDLNGTEFDIPSEVGNPLYGTVTPLTEAALTDRTVGGTGMFDGLMEALNEQLKSQFDAGRLTGAEYGKAYIALTTAAMSAAVSYLTAKETTYYQALLAQAQAQRAEVEVVQSRLNLEITRYETAKAKADLGTAKAAYSLTKLQLASEDARYAGILLTNDKILVETGLLTSQTEKTDYEITNLLPKEVLRLQSQIDVASAQISHTTAQKDQVLYQTTALLPAQKLNVDADTSVKSYQHLTMLPAQVAGITEDTAGKAYTNDFILPANLENIREQTESHRAKTLDTRTDGITPVTGAIGKQKELQQQQIDSYKRDAESKVAKMLLDSWVVQRTTDENIAPPSGVSDANINTVLTKLRLNTGLD